MATPAAEPIRIEIPLPLPLRTANAWLFPGRGADVPALVDCGIGTPDGYSALREGLGDAGVDANGLKLFVTHGHVDHAGNAARLRREFGALLSAPRAEAAHIETFRRDADRRLEAFSRALVAHGVPPADVERMRVEGRRFDSFLDDVPIQSDVADGQKVMLGATAATAHHAPGHTPGSVLLLTDGNELLTGDTLLQHITSNAIELLDSDRGRYAQYLRTLDGLRKFVGCRALPGHHAPFDLTHAVLDDHLAKHSARSRRVLAALDRPKTAWQVVSDVLPHLAQDQAFLGVCEVVGHLHALEAAGRVESYREGDVRRWARP